MADLLDTTRREIEARLGELRPLVQEAAKLEAALLALDGMGKVATAPSRRRPRASSRRRGRSSSSIARALIDYLRANPGSTAGDAADALGLKRASVSTRLGQLAKAGELTKAERGYAAP